MATTSAAMSGEETPEQKQARIKANRQAGAAKAREAKATQKQSNGEVEIVDATSERKTEMWDKVFVAFMTNFAVKSLNEVERVVNITDSTIKILEEKGKL